MISLPLRRAGWLLQRALIVFFAGLSVLTASLSAFVLAPFYSRMLFGSWAFWNYWDTFPRVTLHVAKIGLRLVTDKAYRNATSVLAGNAWMSPPMGYPDLSVVAVRADWPYSANNCGPCGRCCLKLACPLFDPRTRFCGAYGSPFWNLFPCGRYPATQTEIDYFECPKWRII